ncbi:Hypothetical protein DPCES_2278 [Desulfitobacterium hafniense]|uniref:Uncharacterized protein n=1 Tax=Desulfitobacterium hafniense TaxID=49338 RepID=A0A098B1E7_DESHA|nr:Hypothetical protein DPCES_2278 [Desulfitobacterium hafniense]
MNITIKATPSNFKSLELLLEKVSEIQIALRKNHPSIVVNVEVEMR